MLGFLCNHRQGLHSFVRTAASSPLHPSSIPRWRGLDARHGRVLLRNPNGSLLVVWDPITDDMRVLPFPPRLVSSCTAVVLCAAAAAGAGAGDCDHHDCQRGPSLVVFVGTDPHNMFVCTYNSSDYFASWSEPIYVQHPSDCYIYNGYSPPVLHGTKLYFGIPLTNTALQYDLELREVSWIQLPTLHYCYQRGVLTTTEDGLGMVSLSGCNLCVWLRMDTPEAEANAGWIQFKVIELWGWLHDDPVYINDGSVVGFADGLDIVFVTVNGALCTVDLKTYRVKKVHECRAADAVFPYMRFYSPALEAACLGEEPSAAGSSA